MTDAYFDRLRGALHGLPDAEVAEIVSEVQAHIAERAETIGIEEALRAFGDPGDIAALYLADRLTGRPERPSPWRLLRAARLVARLGIKGLTTLLVSLAGYGFGLLLIAMALSKPFTPDRVGLWVTGGDDPAFSLGRSAAPQGVEVLGWWVIPIGLLLGAASLYLTWRVSLSSLRSMIATRLPRR